MYMVLGLITWYWIAVWETHPSNFPFLRSHLLPNYLKVGYYEISPICVGKSTAIVIVRVLFKQPQWCDLVRAGSLSYLEATTLQ